MASVRSDVQLARGVEETCLCTPLVLAGAQYYRLREASSKHLIFMISFLPVESGDDGDCDEGQTRMRGA